MNVPYGPPTTGFPPAPAPWTLPPMPHPGYPAPPAPPLPLGSDQYAPYGAPPAAPAGPPMQAQRGGPELIYAVIVTVAQKIWGGIKAFFGG